MKLSLLFLLVLVMVELSQAIKPMAEMRRAERFETRGKKPVKLKNKSGSMVQKILKFLAGHANLLQKFLTKHPKINQKFPNGSPPKGGVPPPPPASTFPSLGTQTSPFTSDGNSIPSIPSSISNSFSNTPTSDGNGDTSPTTDEGTSPSSDDGGSSPSSDDGGLGSISDSPFGDSSS